MKCLIALAILSALLVGCSQHSPLPKSPTTFSIASRQLPPEPAFKSTRWVRPPEVPPIRNNPVDAGVAQISPIFQYSVTKVPLKEAILILAAPLKYQSYCSSQVASRTLSMNSLGTIEELSREIEILADISVVVDHQLREVRFLTR